MKKAKRLWALLLAMVMALGLITTAFAAPTIDSGRKASLSLYKYDITAASADGAWDAASYVSTGVQDDAVTDKLAKYAIQGVEFTYLRVASIRELYEDFFIHEVERPNSQSKKENSIYQEYIMTNYDPRRFAPQMSFFGDYDSRGKSCRLVHIPQRPLKV